MLFWFFGVMDEMALEKNKDFVNGKTSKRYEDGVTVLGKTLHLSIIVAFLVHTTYSLVKLL